MWQVLWRMSLLALWLVCCFLVDVRLGFVAFGYILVSVLIVSPIQKRRASWIYRLRRSLRDFQKMRNRSIAVYYSPKLTGQLDLPLVLKRCTAEFKHIAGAFSELKPRKPSVYVFANSEEIANLTKHKNRDFAVPKARLICILYDGFLGETVRHELTHLFACRWNENPPVLLREGLAVYMQRSMWGLPVDIMVSRFLDERKAIVPFLLDDKEFFAAPRVHANYALAGSFIGFLIRRYGWSSFRELYTASKASTFEENLRGICNATLTEAETAWRIEVAITNALLKGAKYTSGGVNP
jgi:hypothetical protein